jgi:hypothetical protein
MDYFYQVRVLIITANQSRSLEPFVGCLWLYMHIIRASYLISCMKLGHGDLSLFTFFFWGIFSPFLSGSIAPSVVCNLMYVWDGKKEILSKLFAWNSSIQESDQGCFLTQAYLADHPSENAWDCTSDLLLSWSWRSHKRFWRKWLWYIYLGPFQSHLSLCFFLEVIYIYIWYVM